MLHSFFYVNTVSDKVVRHSMAYLLVQKYLVGDGSFCMKMKILPKLTHPFWKRHFWISIQYSLIVPQR